MLASDNWKQSAQGLIYAVNSILDYVNLVIPGWNPGRVLNSLQSVPNVMIEFRYSGNITYDSKAPLPNCRRLYPCHYGGEYSDTEGLKERRFRDLNGIREAGYPELQRSDMTPEDRPKRNTPLLLSLTSTRSLPIL